MPKNGVFQNFQGPKKGCRGSLWVPRRSPDFFRIFLNFHIFDTQGGRGGVLRSYTRKVGHLIPKYCQEMPSLRIWAKMTSFSVSGPAVLAERPFFLLQSSSTIPRDIPCEFQRSTQKRLVGRYLSVCLTTPRSVDCSV